MYPSELRQLLSFDTFGPDIVARAAELCDKWFMDEGTAESFVFRSVFRDLLAGGWDDPQGIPTPIFEGFTLSVLPRLNRLLAMLPGEATEDLRDLANAYRDFLDRPTGPAD